MYSKVRVRASFAVAVRESTLQKRGVGLAHGRVRAELDGRSAYERARRHDDLMLVTRHVPRLRQGHAVDGRGHLDALTESDQPLRRAQLQRLMMSVRRSSGAGVERMPSASHTAAANTEVRTALRHHMGSEGTAPDRKADSCPHSCPTSRADARRGQAVADAVDHVLSAHDIAARGRKAAARGS